MQDHLFDSHGSSQEEETMKMQSVTVLYFNCCFIPHLPRLRGNQAKISWFEKRNKGNRE
jgi:hypothetical protein